MKLFDETLLVASPDAPSTATLATASDLRVTLHRPASLCQSARRHWANLTASAAPGNIFAADWFMEPALRHCGHERSLRLAVVENAAGLWLGALPLTLEPQVGRWPAPTWQGWHAANQFIGTPLIRAGGEKAFWQALLAHFDRHPGLALALYIDTLPLTDPSSLALIGLCAEQGRALHGHHTFTRPARIATRPVSGADADANNSDLKKLNKRLDGLERKLAQAHGPVALVLHQQSEACEPWLAAFLALERAGWKGRADSAIGCHKATAGLFREVIREGHKRHAVRLASLIAGERIVAMTSWLVADGRGYGFKMAFDEAFRSFAPGRLLMRRVAALAKDEAITLFDTCAVPDAPGDPLWPDRRAFGSFAVGIGGRARKAAFNRLMAMQTAWHRL